MSAVRWFLVFTLAIAAFGQNKPQRLEWFQDQGFGLFIHWSLDSQTGVVISHSMVGASDDYLKRFINDLPKTFNPRKFHPEDWAALAKLAGIRYVVFTTKHHSGFTMFDSATTDFSIMRTPFGRDATAEILKAFRDQGIAPGMYFSPDDFWWLYKNNKVIQRHVPDVKPVNNPGLLAHDQAQVRELLTKYGPVDVIFFDGAPEGLRELAWKLQPNIVVTRGAIQTPEQYVPGIPLDGAWEACITMGTAWQYQPRNESYKTGGQVISLLVETRAKGGNLLMNVGPKPDGELPIEQEERLREVALWMMVNQESIYSTRPWVVTNEKDIWFTKKKDADTVFAIVKEKDHWKRGEWKDLVLHSVRSTAETKVNILGQNDLVLEYQPTVVPKTTWHQEADGLHIRAMRAQRLQDNSQWPNPVVLKITNVKPALRPPVVLTSNALRNGDGTVVFEGNLKDLGDEKSLEVGFEYRPITGQDANERTSAWLTAGFVRRNQAGDFSVQWKDLKRGETYEYRAVARHPLLTIYGAEKKLAVP
ncbi:MAG: alpha-L-fucosidase [Bryobacteraceae bacterium]